MNGELDGPYAPPAAPTGAAGAHEDERKLARRLVRWALIGGVGWSLAAGVLMAATTWAGLSRFGGHPYVPRVILLALLRSDGAQRAAAAAFVVAAWLTSRESNTRRTPLRRLEPAIGLSVYAVAFIGVVLGMAPAYALWTTVLERTTAEFFGPPPIA
jgi:hypothetical protein